VTWGSKSSISATSHFKGELPRTRRVTDKAAPSLMPTLHRRPRGAGSPRGQQGCALGETLRDARRDAGRRSLRGNTAIRGRGERIRAVHELHRALANVTRTGNEQLRGEAAQIVAEATSRLNGLLAADR
jgi:hypothetical protein